MAVKKRYTREQRRVIKEKKQLKTNDKIAKAMFIPSLVFFLFVVVGLLVPFIVGFIQGLMEGSVTPESMGNTNVMPLASTLEGSETDGAGLIYLVLLILAMGLVMLWMAMGSFVCPFILALGLRRGEDKDDRVKKGWIVLYIVLMCLTWVPVLIFGGNPLYAIILIFVLGGGDAVLMILAHQAGLFEAKKSKLRRKEEGKLHGGVFFIYVITKVGLCLGEITMGYSYFAVLGLCLLMIGVAALKRLPYRKVKAPMVYSPYTIE